MVHLQQAGFRVDSSQMPAPELAAHRSKHGVPARFSSCHTALVGGYVIEGHVPADIIQRLLAERPDIVGVTVPGMPAGSPGMKSPNPVPYDILAIERDGSTRVYAKR